MAHERGFVLGIVIRVYGVILTQLRDKLRTSRRDGLYACAKLYDAEFVVLIEVSSLYAERLRAASEAVGF